MSPTGDGRFCNACEKVVTDFTNMTDEQLLNFFTKRAAGDHPCGRFRQDQLNRAIALPDPPKKNRLFKLAASVLLAQVMFYQGKALGKTSQQIEIVSNNDTTADGNIKITGLVLDYHSNKPIAGLKVYIDNTAHYFVTDKKGRFTIVIPGNPDSTIRILTEYINNKNYVAGSIILAKEGSIRELSRTELTLYRYPEETLEEVQLIEYKAPLITMGFAVGGGVTVTTKKETFWHKLTRVFRRK